MPQEETRNTENGNKSMPPGKYRNPEKIKHGAKNTHTDIAINIAGVPKARQQQLRNLKNARACTPQKRTSKYMYIYT